MHINKLITDNKSINIFLNLIMENNLQCISDNEDFTNVLSDHRDDYYVINKCRRDVLEMVNDKNGRHIAIQHPQNCTVCNDCVRACKFKALSLVDRINKQ